ncbi:D-amino acid dehydrogenase [Undibacterium sp. CY7W]|uniref:D-amino acid dehydrogenase n=1 Tax=Undibacterium rugosum TaxID=2762291 RepID=A0A923I5W1_9BURK|nr:D-amino acid dehydrogenase [Undibacterium rugosum]MBC3936146.1 D-amino acid dehydrogenase [Undibacterium rugosum]
MKVIILGAGIIGTCTAWVLARQGHEVTVVERQPAVALETSFANGGQISVSHAEPWANPAAPGILLRSLGKEDAPLLFRLHADWQQWRWALAFLRECSPHRTRQNLRQIVALADYSRRCLVQLRAETGIVYDDLQRGILHFYTDEQEFTRAQRVAAQMRELGCERQTLTREQVLHTEPALYPLAQQLVGGDYTASDESGDIQLFARQLAEQASALGVRFLFQSEICRLIPDAKTGQQLSAIEIIDPQGQHQQLTADAYVMALGSYSAALLRPLGIRLSIFPAKGYSATFTVTNPQAAPQVSLTDDAHKLVFSRLGPRLRVAGTCEINDYSRALNPVRCEALRRRTRELFPDACDYEQAHFWAGLRPLTPSNRPYIGASQMPNLYLNTGHGSLGWTMAAGSAYALADIMAGRRPDVDFLFST